MVVLVVDAVVSVVVVVVVAALAVAVAVAVVSLGVVAVVVSVAGEAVVVVVVVSLEVVVALVVVEDVVVSAEAADKRRHSSPSPTNLKSFEPRHKNATHEKVLLERNERGGKKERETSVFFWRYTVLFPIIVVVLAWFWFFSLNPPISDPVNVRSIAQHWDSVQTQRIQEGKEERENKDGQTFYAHSFPCLLPFHDCAVYDNYNYRRSSGYIKLTTNSSQAP